MTHIQIGPWVTGGSNGCAHAPEAKDRPPGAILRFDGLPATPRNVERMRARVRLLNRRLAKAGTPIRLRLV